MTSEKSVPAWVVGLAVVALVAVAIPNWFFTTPFRLHIDSNMKGFYGLSIWGPSMLAAAAFFAGVDYFDRLRPAQRSLNALTVLGPLLWAVFVSQWFPGMWQNVTAIPEKIWQHMAMYAGLFAIQVLFYQGLLQQRILGARHRYARAFLPGLAAVLVMIPCARHMVDMQTSFQEFLLPAFVQQSILSGLVESGATLMRVMAVAGVMGAIWIWFHQGIF